MRIFQKITTDQIFIISGSDLLFQEGKCVQRFYMDKRLFVIIEPAVQHLKTIHQSLRITAKISLPIAEFMIIDSCLQCFFIHPILYNLLQNLLNLLHKRFLLLCIGVFRDHREDRLINSIVIRAHNILSNPRFRKRLLKRCSRR